MILSELCRRKRPTLSFEVFPPKRDRPVESIYAALERLAGLSPDYISVTYGAGGSAAQQAVTCAIASRIKTEHSIEPLAHLTCVNSTAGQVDAMLDSLAEAGIRNLLALRGDRLPDCAPSPDFAHAADLIEHIARRGGFDIAAACYPEGHPDCDSVEQDVKFVKEKVERGASHLISQLFFDNDDFYRMRELCRASGINVPIHAGVMPVLNARQIERMVLLCGAKIPPRFSKIMSRYGDNPDAMRQAGIAYATEQIVELFANDVDGVHLYTMNNPDVAEGICRNLEHLLKPAGEASV